METTFTASVTPADSRLRRTLRQLGIDSGYVLLGLPLALVAFVLCLVGFVLGVGTAVLVGGLPVLTGTCLLARAFATTERNRAAPVLGVPLPEPVYKRPPPGAGAWRRIFTPLTDSQSWLDLAHTLANFVVTVPTFCFVFAWWAATITGLSYPLYDWALPHHPDDSELHELLGFEDTAFVRIPLNLAIGLVFAATLIPVVEGSALVNARVARGMLASMAELRQRIVGLEEENAVVESQRTAAVSAEAIALRRLERDIHDGPQQRLVRLAMDLGRAQHQFDADPSAARLIVAEALFQTRETLDELRALSRGIAPPVLVDRGLTAALASLAGRSTVPVDLEAGEVGRLAPEVETAAYFVVAEALTNVAKHSSATECRVELRRTGGDIVVTVADDGVGGAHLAKGHGLTGLADRVHASGGRLTVDSPVGAGTTVTAVLPL